MILKKLLPFLFFLGFMSPFLFAEKYAVIIGINEYEELNDLAAAVNDSEKMASLYKGLGFKVWLLSDRQESLLERPSLTNIKRVASNIEELSYGEKIDELVFFFAGHGVQISGENFLCFPETEINSRTGMLSVDKLLIPWIRDISPATSMVYLDACRNDLGSMRAAGVTRGLEIKNDELQRRRDDSSSNMAVFYAARPGSFSFEKPDGTNGFFTDTLIEAIQSPTTETISDLYKYIKTALPERTEKAYGRPQIPHMGGDFDLEARYTKGTVDLGSYDTTARLFVDSSMANATVKIDGIVRGNTPILIEGINPGKVTVEVSLGDYYASQQLNLSPRGFEKIDLTMEHLMSDIYLSDIAYEEDGALVSLSAYYIKRVIEVYVNGYRHNEFDFPMINNIPPGNRQIVLKGDGWYWERDVTLEPNESPRIDVVLKPVGSLDFSLKEEDVKIQMENQDTGQILTSYDLKYSFIYQLDGEGEKDFKNFSLSDIPAGKWLVTINKEGYSPWTQTVEIEKGKTRMIEAAMTRDHHDKFEVYLPLEALGGNYASSGLGMTFAYRTVDIKILGGGALYKDPDTYSWSVGTDVELHPFINRIPLGLYLGGFFRYNYFENTEYSNVQPDFWLGTSLGLEWVVGNFALYGNAKCFFTNLVWFWPDFTICAGVKLWL